MKGLENKRVFITGGAGGIGLATAERFFHEGANLVLIDMPSLDKTTLKEKFSDRMIYIEGDVTKEQTLAAIQEEMIKGVDVLINNAGITRDAAIHKMSDEQFDQVVDVNLKAVWKLSQMASLVMKEKGNGGVILNAASVVAHYGNFGQSNYVATKAAVIGLTKTLSKELGRFGIRVNSVAPGSIGTEMVRNMPEKVLAMINERTPLQRIGRPDEVAAAYAFLASDDAAFITGTNLNVDGGLILG